MFKKITLVSLLTVAGGCAVHGPEGVKMYKGIDLPHYEEAMIQGSNNYRRGSTANEVIRIVEVDGVKVPRNGFSEGADLVRLSPGYHIVKVMYVHGGRNGIDYYSYDSLPIKAAPNCTYQIVAKFEMAQQMLAFSWLGFSTTGAQSKLCEINGNDYDSDLPIKI